MTVKARRQKRPADLAERAKMVVDIAAGEIEDREPTPGEQGMPQLVVAWFASTFACSAAYLAWMFIAVRIIEDSRLPAFRGILRITLLAVGSSLTIQLVYGSLLLIVLKPIGLFRPPVVLLAYLVPLLLLSWCMSDTTNDLIGTLPWLAFASILALVFWFFAR